MNKVSTSRIGGLLALTLSLMLPGGSAQAQTLGAAANYNLFVLGNANAQFADTEGAAAIGGSAKFTGWTFGAELTSPPTPTAVVVGGALDFSNGTINGNAAVGGAASVTSAGFGNGGSLSANQGTNLPVDFAAASTYLNSLSDTLASNIGTYVNTGGVVTLAPTATGISYFTLSQSAFTSLSSLTVDLGNNPGSKTVYINVEGNNFTTPRFSLFLKAGQQANSLDAAGSGSILFNFNQATSFTMNGFGASVLAPRATVQMAYGQVNGNFVVGNLGTVNQAAQAEFHLTNNGGHNTYFSGSNPGNRVPEPGTLALLALALPGLALLRRR